MNACKCQILDRHYSAPLLTPPLKFVMFFSSIWSSTSCGVFRGGGIFYRRCLTYIHRDPKKKKREKKGKKVFAEENGLKGDPRLPTICQASELFLTSPNKIYGCGCLGS
ncbi:uncharacterized protein DS421_3g99330 [Arachis hypogaea]|nr:uncharacterized protein DS421_3g99330 [Arachis hypogaea]